MKLGNGYVHVEAPQIVATRTGTAFLGDNAVAAEPTDSGFVPVAGWPRGAGMLAGFLVRPNGDVVALPSPPRVRAFIGVRAASHAGVAHVFWAGSADTSAHQWQHLNALWYARFDGDRWTEPEMVLADTTVLWASQSTSVVIADGRAHLTAPLNEGILGGNVLHVVRDAHGRGTAKRLGFQALYTHLAAYSDGTLVLATISGARPDRAQVLIRRSTDGGRSWDAPTVVYRSGLGTAYDPRLVVTPDGSLYAAWIVEAPGVPGRAASIHASVSTDRGTTWRGLAAATAAPEVRDLWAVADGQGTVHIVFHSGENDGVAVGMSLLDDHWGSRFTRGPTPFAATMYALTPDSLYLAWHEWREGGPERIPSMMVSRRTLCPDISPER